MPDKSEDDSSSMVYFIMPRYGKDLDHLLSDNIKNILSPTSVYHLGIHLLNILEAIHEAGLVYNDLKLDNILLDFGENIQKIVKPHQNCFKNLHLNVIDFGLVSNW